MFRKAVLADLDVIVASNIALAAESEGLALDRVVVESGVRAVLSGAVSATYFVMTDDQDFFIGQAMITKEWSDWRNGDIWWLQSVYVAPAHRRRGVFRKMYAALSNEAKRAGARSLRLYVDSTNAKAQQAYAAVGMKTGHYLLYEADWGNE
ncbi:MAG: GNAT family N-acetyltransferase [Deltaproteobacteria bacterium]|nr:GNAT family N-acetyltransferase [Deltaproteobacteria bacterium]